MIIDLTKPVEASHDPDFLSGVLSALVGQPCVKAGISYGGELVLHFGPRILYTHPKLAGGYKGAWQLGSRGSSWRLLSARHAMLVEAGLPAGPKHWPPELIKLLTTAPKEPVGDAELDRALASIVGESIARARPFPIFDQLPEGVALELLFSNGDNLIIFPTPEGDEGEEPLADWELFTPHHMYLRCGPGFVWSYLRSDIVEKADKKDGAA